MAKKVALIAGIGGMCGSNMARLLAEAGGWEIVGISRRKPEIDVPHTHIALDMLDPAQCRDKLAGKGEVTHLFWTALINGRDLDEENELNTTMFRNLMDGFMPGAEALEHVHVLEGAKWYGYHLGPYKTPAREDDPPCRPAYFYEYQHECVLDWQRRGGRWSWSTTRPGAVCGYSPVSHINLMSVVGVYASLCKALDRPLTYPGSESAYRALTFASDVGMLNRAMLWASTDPAAANQAFNIANGDAFRWEHMWPRVAEMFDIEPGPVEPMPMVDFMADKAGLWRELAQEHGLRQPDLQAVVPWSYADAVFSRDWDNLLSTVKANHHGFTEMIDTEEMFARIFGEFRDQKVIP